MAFKKVGDEQAIEGCFDDNGKECFCVKCGRKLQLIALADENELVCAKCQIEQKEELN